MVDEGVPAAAGRAAASVAAVFMEATTAGRPLVRPRGTSSRAFELVHDVQEGKPVVTASTTTRIAQRWNFVS